MKKLLIIMLMTLCLAGCSSPEPEVYVAPGHYYTHGEIITEDGNIWGYSQDLISNAPSYDNESVYVLFDDAGTPDNIYDDEVIDLVAR